MVVVGRSKIVGSPAAALFMWNNGTVVEYILKEAVQTFLKILFWSLYFKAECIKYILKKFDFKKLAHCKFNDYLK